MLYDYLITAYKVLIGLITAERLVAIALGAFGVYLVWIVLALVFSFQRKFNSRCQKLISYLISHKEEPMDSPVIAESMEKISSGASHGWKKFKSSQMGKPSDYMNRNDCIDIEMNGGVLNQGKTLMRTYIVFISVVLFLLNFAFIGGENTITFMSFAESLVLPLIFYIVLKMFYFLYNSIRQRLYRTDVASFYELMDLLDAMYVKKVKVVEDAEAEAEGEESEEGEELAEDAEEEQEEKPGDILDKYDIFKKKNIDVNKLADETPSADTSLPFINVDSDYVIKEDKQEAEQAVNSQDSTSSILGGMMQNTSGTKKTSFIEVEKNVAEIDSEKVAQINQENSEETTVENKQAPETSEAAENANAEASEEPEKTETEPATELKDDKFIEIEENVVTKKNEDESIKEDIASVVGGFKSNRSALASGGMVIERNQPIAKRERPVVPTKEEVESEPEEESVTRPIATENTETILNTLKSVPGNYDNYAAQQPYQQSPNYGVAGYDQGYGYNNPNMYAGQMQGYGYTPEPQAYQGYQQNGFGATGYQNYNQTPYYNNEPEPQYEEVSEEETPEEKPAKKKVVRTKENEPRPRNLRASSKKEEKEDDSMANRGRPRNHEVSETMVIKDDKEFNEVLSRAEKLMRKSEEGLSDSQSKRIEKEIKILMDAMNRYKESNK